MLSRRLLKTHARIRQTRLATETIVNQPSNAADPNENTFEGPVISRPGKYLEIRTRVMCNFIRAFYGLGLIVGHHFRDTSFEIQK